MCGEAVYCQKLDNEHYCVGFKFTRDRIPWSVYRGSTANESVTGADEGGTG
jgi:hypothetical protein